MAVGPPSSADDAARRALTSQRMIEPDRAPTHIDAPPPSRHDHRVFNRRSFLAGSASGLVLAGGLHCAKEDCSAVITDAHLTRLQSYANFFKLIRSLLDLYLRNDYVTTLKTISATIDNPTIKRLADDLVALVSDDTLQKIKAELPVLARTALDLELKTVDDPTAFIREKIIDLIKRTTFVGDLDIHARAIEAAPDAIRKARLDHNVLDLAAAATNAANALAYFNKGVEELRALGTSKLPHLDVSLIDAIAVCTAQSTTAITGTLDTALRDSQDLIDALRTAIGRCVGE